MKKEELVEALSKLTVLELADLKSALEDKWGVSAAAPVAIAAAAPVAAAAAAEPTEFTVTLDSFPDDKKMGVIKVVKDLLALGLKESKDFVEAAPKVIKEGLNKAAADELVKKLQEAGAKVTVKGV